MTEPIRKRRGPLLWLAGFVSHRPVAAVVLGLLLVLVAVVSWNWAFVRMQQQRAREMEVRAQQARDRLIMEGRKLHERALEQEPQDDTDAP